MKIATALRSLVLAVSTAVTLTSCAEPIIPRQQTFRPSDFVCSQERGSASITGRAFVTMRDNSERIGVQQKVELTPVTPYTSEAIGVEFTQSRSLSAADPRIDKYIRSTEADDQGRFSFRGLPPGEYYATSNVKWDNWYWNDDVTQKIYVHYTVPIHARVSVKNGQTVVVRDWVYGKTIVK